MERINFNQACYEDRCKSRSDMHILLSNGLMPSVLGYSTPAELVAVAIAFPLCKDVVRELHHNDDRYEAVVMHRLTECREILLTNISDISEGEYLPLGTWVYIDRDWSDEEWYDDHERIDGVYGRVVLSYYIGWVRVTFALVDHFLSCGPKLVAKGSRYSLKEVEPFNIPCPPYQLPPRNRREQLHSLHHFGLNDAYWEFCEKERRGMLARAERERGRDAQDCFIERYSSLRILNVLDDDETRSIEALRMMYAGK